eukprot:CAMPEP_0113277420 /NCGR_PEP_ID=MMETSP0008_2-20120614/26038_1 /TAXON_ID=97485 /ORGANISM="Prymnesium parvum" /LENGTH=69 /DNA_ID=CAMNT_0000127329 /DNA_START=386 /DNA_END=591 /DNA_ORIENTATION=- /assembly_acc=CAM_ASM_000153
MLASPFARFTLNAAFFDHALRDFMSLRNPTVDSTAARVHNEVNILRKPRGVSDGTLVLSARGCDDKNTA